MRKDCGACATAPCTASKRDVIFPFTPSCRRFSALGNKQGSGHPLRNHKSPTPESSRAPNLQTAASNTSLFATSTINTKLPTLTKIADPLLAARAYRTTTFHLLRNLPPNFRPPIFSRTPHSHILKMPASTISSSAGSVVKPQPGKCSCLSTDDCSCCIIPCTVM